MGVIVLRKRIFTQLYRTCMLNQLTLSFPFPFSFAIFVIYIRLQFSSTSKLNLVIGVEFNPI